MRPARQPTDVRSSSSLALLITLCLVLQWGGARIFNFDPSATDGGTKGTALSQVLLFSTNAVALWIVLTSPNTRDLVRRCWPIMLLPGLATVSALWHSGYLEVLVAFGYLSALVVIMVHFWLFKGTRSLLLTAAKKHAHLAAIPISLIFVAGLLNYSESLLMSYASIFTVLTPLAAAWVFQLTSPYALAQDQQLPTPERFAPEQMTGRGQFPERHKTRSPSTARTPGPRDGAKGAPHPLARG